MKGKPEPMNVWYLTRKINADSTTDDSLDVMSSVEQAAGANVNDPVSP